MDLLKEFKGLVIREITKTPVHVDTCDFVSFELDIIDVAYVPFVNLWHGLHSSGLLELLIDSIPLFIEIDLVMNVNCFEYVWQKVLGTSSITRKQLNTLVSVWKEWHELLVFDKEAFLELDVHLVMLLEVKECWLLTVRIIKGVLPQKVLLLLVWM